MKIELIFKGKVIFTFLLIQVFTIALSQSVIIDSGWESHDLYDMCMDKYGIDQLLANGVYFEDFYRTALGHPYLNDDDFVEGSVIYHNTSYSGLKLKFDLYSGQLLLKQKQSKFHLVTILTNEFLSAFEMKEMHFRKITFIGMEPAFYQVIKGEGEIQCYYKWCKTRREIIKDEESLIYNFSGDKRQAYLFVNGQLKQFRRNRSFWRLFPDELETSVYNYLRTNRIRIKNASDEEMRELIDFCQDLLKQRKM